ncbi:MAG TPA: divalent cation transporter [Bacteroidetes bacterium]|nr:divalent cation transporter [Bacteroidota bacterium]
MYAKEMAKQSLPLLIACGLGAIVAGSTLGLMLDLFKSIPGLIVVIPGIIDMRGNISTALGSRLGSAYHLGIIDSNNLWNDELKQNILGSIVLSFLVSIIIGTLAYISSLLLGVTPDVLKLIVIVIITGIMSALFLTLLTIVVIYLAFKRGYDPDNITGPTLATFGDIVTIFCLYGSAILVEAII